MVVESYTTKVAPVEVRHPVAALSPPTRRPWLDLLAAVVVVALLALGVWCAYWADHRNDQYQLILLGQTVYHGGQMYVDAWENKPPGVAWLSGLGFIMASGKQFGAWVLPAVTALSCILVLSIAVARSLSPTAGRRAALLAALLGSIRLYDASSINPDFYAAMFELAACGVWLAAVTTARGWNGAGLSLLAGLLWAAATSVKQAGVAGLVVITLVSIVTAMTSYADRRRWLGAAALSWVGFLIGAGVVAAVLYRSGTHWQAWEAVFTFNRDLLGADWYKQIFNENTWLRVQRDVLGVLGMPMWLGAFAIVVTLFVGRMRAANSVLVVALGLWLIAAGCLALLGPSRAMRYWQATFPPLVVLGAIGLFHLEEMYRRLERGYRAALVVVSLTAMIVLGRPLFEAYRHGVVESYVAYHEPRNERRRLEQVGEQVKQLAAPGERIYVWAYMAGVYVHADRRPASRFTYPRTSGQMKEILDDLSTAKPRLIAMLPDGSPDFDRLCDEDCHWKRAQILADYVQGPTVDGLQLWTRGGEATASQ